MDKNLPVGSVVKFTNNEKEYTIIGKNVVYENKKYDYMCVEYPGGFSPDIICEYFNDSEVKIVCFYGDVN